MSRPKEPIQILDHLVALCSDAILGYRHAARAVHDPELRAMLEHNASEREEIASVLTYKLVEMGHKPKHDGSIAGAIHRRFLDATAAIEHTDPAPLLRVCASGERETLEQFSFALGQPLPDDVHTVVQTQLGRVLSASAALQRARQEIDAAKRS